MIGLMMATLLSNVFAHHAFEAEFDRNAKIAIKGKITKVELINPHAWIHLRVEEPGRPPQDWMVEGGSPNTLFRSGFTKDSIKIGSEIQVTGYQSRDKGCKPACKAAGRDVTFTDGRRFFIGTKGSGAPGG